MPGRSTFAVVAIVAAALLGAGPAASQPASPDATAAARELLTTMRMADQLKAILPLLMQQLKPAIVQGAPRWKGTWTP